MWYPHRRTMPCGLAWNGGCDERYEIGLYAHVCRADARRAGRAQVLDWRRLRRRLLRPGRPRAELRRYPQRRLDYRPLRDDDNMEKPRQRRCDIRLVARELDGRPRRMGGRRLPVHDGSGEGGAFRQPFDHVEPERTEPYDSDCLRHQPHRPPMRNDDTEPRLHLLRHVRYQVFRQ